MYQQKSRFEVLLLVAATALGMTAKANAAYTTETWLASPANGSWSNAANWSGGVVPNGSSYIADFGSSSVTSVSMSSYTSLYQMTFESSASNYTISSSSILTFSADAGSGIIVNGGSQTISAGIRSYGNFAVTNNSSQLLNFTGEFGANTTVVTGTVSGSGNVKLAYLTRGWCGAGYQFDLVKSGSGLLTIVNAYGSSGGETARGYSTGTMAILGGVVAISSEGCLGGNPGGYWSGTTWIDGSFNGSALTLNGGALEATGSLTIDDSNRGVTIGSNGGTLSVDSGAVLRVDNAITGTGALSKTGNGILIFVNANNTYAGGTSINGGFVYLGNATAFGSGAVTIGNGNYISLWFNTGGSTVANDFVLNGIGGTQEGSTKSAIYGDGASDGYATYTLSGNITLNATSDIGGYLSNAFVVSGKVTGSGGLTKDNGNVVTLSNTANDYAGNTTVSAGTLQLGAAGVIPDGAGKGNVIVNGTFDMNGYNETINGLSGSGTITNSAASANPVLTVGANDQSSTFSGVIKNTAGALSLTKTGTGVLTISGANTYTGATTVNAGTLALGYHGDWISGGALSPSTVVTVNNDATLRIDNWNALGGYPNPLTADPTLTPMVTINSGTMTMSSGYNCTLNALNLNGATVTNVGTGDSGGWGTWNFRGNVNVGGNAVSTLASADMTLDKTGGVTVTVDSGSTLNVTGAFVATTHSTGLQPLIKAGLGTMILSGANTYTGNTTVDAGTLELASTGSLLLDINSGTASSTKITVNGGSILLDGALVFDLTDAALGEWTAIAASNYTGIYGDDFKVKFAYGSSSIDAAELLGVWSYTDTATKTSVAFTGSTGVLSITIIPEPASITLLGTSLCGLLAYAWRRRK